MSHQTVFTFPIALGIIASLSFLACSQATQANDEAASQAEDNLVSDTRTITAREDGTFDVTCKDGRTEVATTDQILANAICVPPVVARDPFDPSTCDGPTITTAEAASHFVPAASVAEIGRFRWLARSRQCNVKTGCGPYSTPSLFARRDYELFTSGRGIESRFAGSDGRYPSQCGEVSTTRKCGSSYDATLTNHCFRLHSISRSAIAADQSYTETEYAALLDF